MFHHGFLLSNTNMVNTTKDEQQQFWNPERTVFFSQRKELPSTSASVSETAMLQSNVTMNQRKKSVSGTANNKPISTSSPAAVAAAQQVTPIKLSQLLLKTGPLAIRFITQALAEEIPSFKDLSASKQRRLIMGALEAGDQESSVIFAKIGWGQWSARKVESHLFIKERELTNIANSKVKDIISQERRRSSSSSTAAAKRSGRLPSFNKKHLLEHPGGTVFIDENALASDDEGDEEEEEEDDDDDNVIKNIEEEPDYGYTYDNFRRRKSSVIDYSSPEDADHELIAAAIRPALKSSLSGNTATSRRRSSSKMRSPSVSKPSSYRGSIASFSSNGSDALESTLKKMSSSNDSRSKSMIELQPSDDVEILPRRTRRESRLSFSKESSIRSTLFSHTNYHIVSPPTLAINYKVSEFAERHKSNPLTGLEDLQHSDTDEEDWASIGAASLRNNSLPPRLSSPMTGATQIPAKNVKKNDVADHAIESTNTETSGSENSPKQEPEDAKDAAFLLMSLKS